MFGDCTRPFYDFIGLPLLSAKTFQEWDKPADHLPLMTSCSLERTVGTKREAFKAPHLVVKQSHKGSRFLADVLDYDAVFNELRHSCASLLLNNGFTLKDV